MPEIISNELFSKAFNVSPNPMLISTLAEGKFIDVNDSFLMFFGYERQEIIGHISFEINIWCNLEYRASIIKSLVDRGVVRNYDAEVYTKKGEVRTVLISAVTFNIKSDKYILWHVIDITERKELEKEMTRLDRLNLVGEMAAGIGHEVRNPMTSVRGFLQLLGEKEECAKFKNYFDLMIEEIDRANAIISEFLSLAKNKVIEKNQ